MKRTTVLTVALALVVGLAGSATAASLITSKDIKNGTIKTADLSTSAKRAMKGQTGARGAAGPQGPVGPQGPAGPLGQQVIEASMVVPPGEVDGPQVFCPAGKFPVGTGFYGSITHPGFVEVFGNSVGAGYINDSSIPVETKVQAICAGGGAVAAAASASRDEARSAFRRALRNLAH